MQFNHPFRWQDPLAFELQLNAAERKVADEAQQFCQAYLMPRVVTDFRDQIFDKSILQGMGQHGWLGGSCAGASSRTYNAVMYGLIARELERVDSGYRSMFSIQSSLVMHAIFHYGNKTQKHHYLPPLSQGKIVGCFGLTEPDHGSDPGHMETRAEKTAQGYILHGVKRWIGMSPVADLFLIWAKDDAGVVRGFLVERGAKNLEIKNINGKLSLRTAPTGEIYCHGVELTKEAMLPDASGFSAPFSCLNQARYSIAWGALGAAEFCWHWAREYTLHREQFGKPLASRQLIQEKLVDMQTQIALALQSVVRVGRLVDEGKASHEMVSLIKRNSAMVALNVARAARDLLGANGILEDQHIMRHLVNLETVNTYEGTYNMHTLILGRAQTDLPAF